MTAGASGVGKRNGASIRGKLLVCVCDIDVTALDTAAKDIPGLTINVCDVSKRQDIERMVAAAVDELGRLDVLVNNAGISGPTIWFTAGLIQQNRPISDIRSAKGWFLPSGTKASRTSKLGFKVIQGTMWNSCQTLLFCKRVRYRPAQP